MHHYLIYELVLFNQANLADRRPALLLPPPGIAGVARSGEA